MHPATTPARWIGFQLSSFVLAFLPFPWIAHGLTGPHGDALRVDQLVAHTAGLLLVAGSLAALRHRSLAQRFGAVPGGVSVLMMAAYPPAFWLGYYTLGIPFDILLSTLVVGAADASIIAQRLPRSARVWGWVLGAYCIAVAVAAACLFPLVPWLDATFGESLSGDVFIWAAISSLVGGVSGVVLAPLASGSAEVTAPRTPAPPAPAPPALPAE